MRALGRLPEFDERSRAYPVRALLGETPALSTKIWDCEEYLDQGAEGACVGFSMAHEIIADPAVGDVDEDYARMIYYEAQKVDQWPGEDYEGTSVLAGAKVLKELGWFEEYRWGFGIEDVIDALVNLGPVVLGINWYTGMWDTDLNGYIHPVGDLSGGHAILAVGYDAERDAVLLHNSWGPSWGVGGDAWISSVALSGLLREFGEACVPLVRVDIDGPFPEPEPEPPAPEPEPEPPAPEPEPEPPAPEPEPEPPAPEPEGCLPKSLRWALGMHGRK